MSSGTNADDPLEGAAVGETRTFEHEHTVDTVMALPSECYGTDRDFDVEVVDTEAVAADHPNDPDNLKITYQVEATKHLPIGWDRDIQSQRATNSRLNKWFASVGKAVSFGLPFVLTGLISTHIMNTAFRDMTINGESVAPVSTVEIWSMIAVLGVLAAIVYWAVNGGIPRKNGVGR